MNRQVTFPLNGIRKDNYGNWQPLLVTDEMVTIDSSSPYSARLDERPSDGIIAPSTAPPKVYAYDGTGYTTQLTRTTSPSPAVDEFFVNYTTATLSFNSSRAGEDVKVEYYKLGSIVSATEINVIADRLTRNSGAPDSTDDEYNIGSIWYDCVGDQMYMCLDNTDDNAVWVKTGTAVMDIDSSGRETGIEVLSNGNIEFWNLGILTTTMDCNNHVYIHEFDEAGYVKNYGNGRLYSGPIAFSDLHIFAVNPIYLTTDASANYIRHRNNNGSKHIPVDGTTGDILQWLSAGTAQWIHPDRDINLLPNSWDIVCSQRAIKTYVDAQIAEVNFWVRDVIGSHELHPKDISDRVTVGQFRINTFTSDGIVKNTAIGDISGGNKIAISDFDNNFALPEYKGGTGLLTPPQYGDIIIGNSFGKYNLVNLESLVSAWIIELTPSYSGNDVILGTSNQVDVTNTDATTWILSTPQDIHMLASPTFANIIITNDITCADMTATNDITADDYIFCTDMTANNNIQALNSIYATHDIVADTLSAVTLISTFGDIQGRDLKAGRQVYAGNAAAEGVIFNNDSSHYYIFGGDTSTGMQFKGHYGFNFNTDGKDVITVSQGGNTVINGTLAPQLMVTSEDSTTFAQITISSPVANQGRKLVFAKDSTARWEIRTEGITEDGHYEGEMEDVWDERVGDLYFAGFEDDGTTYNQQADRAYEQSGWPWSVHIKRNSPSSMEFGGRLVCQDILAGNLHKHYEWMTDHNYIPGGFIDATTGDTLWSFPGGTYALGSGSFIATVDETQDGYLGVWPGEILVFAVNDGTAGVFNGWEIPLTDSSGTPITEVVPSGYYDIRFKIRFPDSAGSEANTTIINDIRMGADTSNYVRFNADEMIDGTYFSDDQTGWQYYHLEWWPEVQHRDYVNLYIGRTDSSAENGTICYIDVIEMTLHHYGPIQTSGCINTPGPLYLGAAQMKSYYDAPTGSDWAPGLFWFAPGDTLYIAKDSTGEWWKCDVSTHI